MQQHISSHEVLEAAEQARNGRIVALKDGIGLRIEGRLAFFGMLQPNGEDFVPEVQLFATLFANAKEVESSSYSKLSMANIRTHLKDDDPHVSLRD